MRSNSLFLGVAALAVTALVAAGCQTHEASASPQPQITQPAPQPKAAPAPSGATIRDGMITQRVFFPGGDENSGQLLVEKTIPAEVAAGKPFEYTIKATNVSQLQLDNVVLTENAPAGFKVAGEGVNVSGPASAAYKFGTLKPGESKTVTLTGTPANPGALTVCASADYLPTFCMTNSVTSPALKITAAGPAEVLVCDPIKYTIAVTNPGVGTTKGVKIQQNLPQGLTTVDGKSSVTIDVGDLAAGASKNFVVNAKAAKTGTFATKASTTAAGGLTADSTDVQTVVKQPVLTIAKTGAQKSFVGQDVAFEVTVTNKGDAVARDAVLVDTVPAGVKIVNASGGTIADNKVTWALGNLNPGASVKRNITLSGSQIGTLSNSATASAYCADAVSASAQATIAGIPAILLEVVDNPDPVLVGSDTTYTIVVTNQGSAPGTNIRIVAQAEDSGQVLATGGDSKGNIAGNKVEFAPIASLAPKARATVTVTVKAVKAADTRFKVSMTSDQIGRPVEETEASNFYQ